MSGLTGIGTTFNELNYHGELFGLTPTETPLLSMAGGVGNGKQTTSTLFEWQTYDLRAPSNRARLEGADAPSAEGRVRSNVRNIVQIYQEAVTTSYTKQAAIGQYSTPGSAPFFQSDGLGGSAGIQNEHTWQVTQSLKQMARDVNFNFWHSTQVIPTDNTTARQSAGLFSVITTNRNFTTGGAEVTAATATDTVTANGHGLSNGDRVVFTVLDVATNIRPDTVYYVINSATNTFKVAATSGGAAITLGTAAPKYTKVSGSGVTTVTPDLINALVQGVFDTGGLMIGDTRTLFVSSTQKVRLTKAYATANNSTVNGLTMNTGRTIAGVAVDSIVTDFGTLNLVVDRVMPPDAVAAVSMEVVDPVFLSIPGKGVLFEEELAKTGSADKSQIYGEIGLAYGAERMHGVLRGLAVA